MPTDEERREVAAKLRDKAGRVCFDGCEVEECLSSGDWRYSYSAGDGARSYMRLADLIEPEERTCRMTVLENARGNPKYFLMYVCSECHGAVVHDRYDPIYYCPNCGAKVVEE